jgi:hypothetical protein
MEIVPTTNSLRDIVDWLKNGDFVCIHTNTDYIYYYSKETCNSIEDHRLIYVNVMPGLLDEGEWPYYIENEGFVKYTKTLPTKPENIYRFNLNY